MESRAMEGNEKGKSSMLEVLPYYGVSYPPRFSSREEGSYKGAKSNLCEEGKGKEQKGKPSGKEEEDKGNNKGNLKGTLKGKSLVRPLANDDLFRPLADNGKDKGKGWGKGCKGGKPIDIDSDIESESDIEESSADPADRWDNIDDFPKHKQKRAAELVARYHALCDQFKDVTTSEDVEWVAGIRGLIQKREREMLMLMREREMLMVERVEATLEREMLMQQLRALNWNQWEEPAALAEESEAGSGGGSGSSGWKMTGAELWNC